MKTGRFLGHGYISKVDGSTQDSWYTYTCGYCGSRVSGAVVARTHNDSGVRVAWLLCPECSNGSVLDPEGIVHPPSKFGPAIEGAPAETAAAYEEARSCISVAAYTACELICRNILMHVAVEKGAAAGKSFADYVTHLETQGYVTPPMKPWVDQIRRIGNAAAHELAPPDKVRAESTLMFTAELLRLAYEMEAMTKKYTNP